MGKIQYKIRIDGSACLPRRYLVASNFNNLSSSVLIQTQDYGLSRYHFFKEGIINECARDRRGWIYWKRPH